MSLNLKFFFFEGIPNCINSTFYKLSSPSPSSCPYVIMLIYLFALIIPQNQSNYKLENWKNFPIDVSLD